MRMEKQESKNTLTKEYIYQKNKGGPHGLGDPDDTYLRKVELDVMIPKKMRAIARAEKCKEEVEEFNKCVLTYNNFKVVYKCRTENAGLWKCLERWYYDEDFKERCKKEYLKERSEYRRTGISRKERQRLESSTL